MADSKPKKRPGPTARKRQLALALRRYRKEADLSCDAVGEALDCSGAKISRIETGRSGVTTRDVRDMLRLYGAPESEVQAMMGIARQAKEKVWWQPYGDALPKWFEEFIGLETETSSIRTYEIQSVPGLLQTEEYARAIALAGRPTLSTEEVERRTQVRMRRQDLLSLPDAPTIWAVLDEGAIRRQVGGAAVMREQLLHLIEASKRPGITVQVLPFDKGATPAMGTSFWILGFPEQADGDVIYLEDMTSSAYLEEPPHVDAYSLVFEHLRAESLGVDDSTELIRQVADGL